MVWQEIALKVLECIFSPCFFLYLGLDPLSVSMHILPRQQLVIVGFLPCLGALLRGINLSDCFEEGGCLVLIVSVAVHNMSREDC